MYRMRIPAPLGKGRMTQQTWCVTSTETIRLIRDGDKVEGGGTEVGGGAGVGRLYTYRYIVTTRMTSALRWAARRAIFNVS